MRIARDHYWHTSGADRAPEPLRWDLFDFAFNAGSVASVRSMQRAVNLCKQSRGQFDLLTTDGVFGPATLYALDDEDPERLLRVFRAYRRKHYLSLAESGKARFIHGWLKRVDGEWNG
jgi:lysozyme family protein